MTGDVVVSLVAMVAEMIHIDMEDTAREAMIVVMKIAIMTAQVIVTNAVMMNVAGMVETTTEVTTGGMSDETVVVVVVVAAAAVAAVAVVVVTVGRTTMLEIVMEGAMSVTATANEAVLPVQVMTERDMIVAPSVIPPDPASQLPVGLHMATLPRVPKLVSPMEVCITTKSCYALAKRNRL